MPPIVDVPVTEENLNFYFQTDFMIR